MTARFVDGYAYVTSVFHPAQLPDDAEPAWFVPAVNGTFLVLEDICTSSYGDVSEYLVATAVPLDNPGTVADRIAIAGDSSSRYMGETAIYDVVEHWVPNDWDEMNHPESAVIRKIAYSNGRFDFARQATVEGGVFSQSMTEHDGMFRLQLVESVEDEGFLQGPLSFVVFDEQMALAGRLGEDSPLLASRTMWGPKATWRCIGYMATKVRRCMPSTWPTRRAWPCRSRWRHRL